MDSYKGEENMSNVGSTLLSDGGFFYLMFLCNSHNFYNKQFFFWWFYDLDYISSFYLNKRKEIDGKYKGTPFLAYVH